jgi:hypothetical protein
MRIFSSTNVHIGPTPASDNGARLQVSGTATFTLNQNANTVISITNSDNTNSTSRATYRSTSGTVTSAFLSISTIGTFIGSETNHDLHLITNGNTRLQITGSTGAATFSSSVTANLLKANDGVVQIWRVGIFRGGLYTLDAAIGSGTDYSSTLTSEADINFLTGGSVTKKVTILAAGNVGIGTPSPPSRLSVQWDKSTLFAGAAIYDSQAFNVSNHGGTLAFGGTFNSGGSYTEWSAIGGMKSNTTDGNVSGDINFYTRLNSSAMTERMRITALGSVLIGSPIAVDNGAILQVDGTGQMRTFTHIPLFHGRKLLLYGPTSSTTIDIPAEFPLMGLVTGNVWAIFGKYCGLTSGGGSEAREFYISRNTSGTWSSAEYGPTANTGGSLSNVSGSGTNLVIATTSNSYFGLELTVMIR